MTFKAVISVIFKVLANMEVFYYKVYLECADRDRLYHVITTREPSPEFEPPACPGFKPPIYPGTEKEYDYDNYYPSEYERLCLEQYTLPWLCNLRYMGYRSYSATDELLEDTAIDFLKERNFVIFRILDTCEIIGSNPLVTVKSAKI